MSPDSTTTSDWVDSDFQWYDDWWYRWDDDWYGDRDDDWTYETDNQFAIDVLRGSLARHQPLPTPSIRCCTECSNLLYRSKPRTVSTLGVDRSCDLCKYLRDISADPNAHSSRGMHIKRKGSDLVLDKQRVLILRLEPDNIYNGIQVGYANLPPVSSPGYFALLRAWLERCNKDHECQGAITKNNLPSRVIDIGQASNDSLILRDSKEINAFSYIALSHCWGQHEHGKEECKCTHKDNLNQRKVGFQVKHLPKTFQDAVEVTRQLDKRYLWIDSLCIIQSLDGKKTDDWKKESKRMEIVFSSAYCTLAATSAEGSHEGFLGPRQSSQPLQLETEDGGRLYVSKEVDNFFEDMKKAPLNGRGWVLQERILSRRTIHFSAKQTYFECGEGVYCENFTFMRSPKRNEYFSIDPQFPDRLLKAGPARVLEFIQYLFQDFSQRQLTNKTDRSVAFSGLESRIVKALKTKSIYGIPKKFIHHTLLWQRPEYKKLNRIDDYNKPVPSWSWMACSGPIEFALPSGITMAWRTALSFEGSLQMAWRTALSFGGSLKNALLAAEVANFIGCELKEEGKTEEIPEEEKGKTKEILKKGGESIGWIRYDIMEDIPEFDLQRCIVVGRDKGANEKYYVLVVNPSSLKDEYTRIGTGAIDSSYLSRIEGKVRVV